MSFSCFSVLFSLFTASVNPSSASVLCINRLWKDYMCPDSPSCSRGTTGHQRLKPTRLCICNCLVGPSFACCLLCWSTPTVTLPVVPAGSEFLCSPPSLPSSPLAAVTMHSNGGESLGLPPRGPRLPGPTSQSPARRPPVASQSHPPVRSLRLVHPALVAASARTARRR